MFSEFNEFNEYTELTDDDSKYTLSISVILTYP